MSARPAHRRPSLRRILTAIVASTALGAGALAAATPADAAGPWFVSPTGANANNCLSAATACLTITGAVNKGTFVSGDTINVAPGVYVGVTIFGAKGANVVGTGAGVILDGGNGTQPTVSVTGAATTVTLTNLTVRNGNSAAFGGGIGVVAGSVVTNNVVVSGNKSPAGAGARVYPGATLTMNGGSITGNTSTATAALVGAGGAVYVGGRTTAGGNPAVAGKLTLDGVTVSDNIATGAALQFTGNGGGVFNSGTTVIKNSTFSGNKAVVTTNATTLRSGQGGAIFNGANDNDDVPVLTVQNTTITGGLPSGQFNASSGGGIANVETTLGGTSASGVLTMSGTTLRGNTALLGGALYNGATATVTGGLIENSAAYSGAGVYNAPIVGPTTVGTTAEFTGTTFNNNVASGLTLANFGNGGAIFNTEKLAIHNATFTGNKAVASTSGGTATGWGGAIWNGAFAANDAPELTITDTDISGGEALLGGAIASTSNVFGFAGAISAKLDAVNLDVTDNTAGVAGGIYAGGKLTLTGGSLSDNVANHASVGYGGGLYAAPAPATQPAFAVTLDSVDVTGNSATVVGGGVALLDKVTAEIRNGSSVSDNTSAINAGGIYNTADLTVRASNIDGNDAGFQGGGVYNGSSTATDTPTLDLHDTSVDGNTAANSGGGLLTIKGATLTSEGGHVNDNSAVGGGGLIVGDSGSATFEGTDFIGNTASASGGGAVLNSGATTISHATIADNRALHTTGNTGIGGAIYSGSNTANSVTTLEIDASTITGNEAYAASVLLTLSQGTGVTNKTSIDRSTITDNTSEINVGAIEQFHPLTITNSTITGNTATGGSGALSMVVPTTVGIAGTIISGNSGPECSGAIADGGYNLSDTGDASCGFSPASNDVAGDPQLGPLVNNGGQTSTRKPGPASPALDRIPAGTSTPLTDALSGAPVTLCGAGSVDQREIARPQGAKCDIGAMEVVQEVPTVDGPATADFTVGSAAAPVSFTTTGTPLPTLAASTLPAGVTFHDNGDGTGSLAGTPAVGTGGDYTITITATNEAGSGDTTIDLTIHEAPILTGPSAATYRVGQLGGPDEFKQTAGHPAATLSTTSTLPTGVGFTPLPGGKGTIGGTPGAGTGGVYPITIKGTNGTPPDATWPFVLTVEEETALTGPATAVFTVGVNGSSGEFSGSGYPKPTLSAVGLPAGLSMASTGPGKGKITGTAANGSGGVYNATVTASNGIGADDSAPVEVTVNEAPEITGPTVVRFVAGFAGLTVYSADGYPQATLSVEGDLLPAGVTFHDNGNGTATLSGTAGVLAVGIYAIKVRASNGIDPDALLNVSFEVAPPLSISTTSLPNATVGDAYGANIVATGGQPTYTFTKIGGALPPGLTLNADGSVTGTPTAAGNYGVTVQVTDSANPQQTATKTIPITVGKGTSTLDVDPVLIQTILPLSVKIGTVGATLTGGFPAKPIANQTVVFKAGNVTVCGGQTNAQGKVTCTMSLANTLLVILNLGVTGTYAGNNDWKPDTDSDGLL